MYLEDASSSYAGQYDMTEEVNESPIMRHKERTNILIEFSKNGNRTKTKNSTGGDDDDADFDSMLFDIFWFINRQSDIKEALNLCVLCVLYL